MGTRNYPITFLKGGSRSRNIELDLSTISSMYSFLRLSYIRFAPLSFQGLGLQYVSFYRFSLQDYSRLNEKRNGLAQCSEPKKSKP